MTLGFPAGQQPATVVVFKRESLRETTMSFAPGTDLRNRLQMTGTAPSRNWSLERDRAQGLVSSPGKRRNEWRSVTIHALYLFCSPAGDSPERREVQARRRFRNDTANQVDRISAPEVGEGCDAFEFLIQVAYTSPPVPTYSESSSALSPTQQQKVSSFLFSQWIPRC